MLDDETYMTLTRLLHRPGQSGAPFRLAERFYGDGLPHWTVGKSEQPAETSAEAEAARTRAVKRLRKGADIEADTPLAGICQFLADLIEGCVAGRRCNSQCCPMCRRALQRWFVLTAPITVKHLKFRPAANGKGYRPATSGTFAGDRSLGATGSRTASATNRQLAAITIIPATRLRGGYDLIHIDRQLGKLIDLLHDAFTQAAIPFAFGGIDVSFNTHPDGAFRPHYQFHLWALAPFDAARRGKAKLCELFPSTADTRTPVHVRKKPFNGNLAGYAYALKTEFVKRSIVPACTAADGSPKRQNTRDKPMTVEEDVRLMLMLHTLGPLRRIFLHGASVENNETGNPVIRPTSPI